MPCEVPSTPPPRAPNRRGRATRAAILDATLALIARRGIHAVTHRAIAAEAGVALASTTYFFASLPQLLHAAFQHHVAQSQPAHTAALAAAAQRVQASVAHGAPRSELHAQLLDLALSFVHRQRHDRAPGDAVEAQYLRLVQPDPLLAQATQAYRQSLVDGLAQVLAPLSGAHAAVDASLLLGAIHGLGTQGLRTDASPETRIRAELGRLLALMVGL